MNGPMHVHDDEFDRFLADAMQSASQPGSIPGLADAAIARASSLQNAGIQKHAILARHRHWGVAINVLAALVLLGLLGVVVSRLVQSGGMYESDGGSTQVSNSLFQQTVALIKGVSADEIVWTTGAALVAAVLALCIERAISVERLPQLRLSSKAFQPLR